MSQCERCHFYNGEHGPNCDRDSLLEAENATLRAENAKLRAAIKRYAVHGERCRGAVFPAECICGLTAALLPPEDSTDGK